MIRTPHYRFPYFQDGELFSAILDKERAIAFDLLLKGLSDMTGDGIIDGWEISDSGGLDVSISPGKGIISDLYGVTKNNVKKTLTDDSTNYIYAIRNSNITDGISTSSNKLLVSFSDIDPPSAPSSLQSSLIEERSISLTWDKSSDDDISYYNIYRKLSTDISYVFISNKDHSSSDGSLIVTFKDTLLEPETKYNYRVSAVDLSGNESSFSTITIDTIADTTPASEVTNVRIEAANKSISLTWDASESSDLDSYVVSLSKLDSSGNVSSTVLVNVGTRLYYFNTALTNNISYRVTIKTLDTSGNVSNGITREFTPQINIAPDEVSVFGYIVTNVRSPEPVTPKVTLSWGPSASSSVSHYNLYIYDEGVSGERIVAGDNTTKSIISFPFRSGQSIVSNLFQDSKDYEAKLTVVNTDGNESDGIFLKLSIPDYSAPPEVKNITSSSGDGYVLFNWEAQEVKDFSYYEFYYWDSSTEDSFSESVSYESFSGSTFTLPISSPITGTYPIGSWVELTSSPSGGGKSAKLTLASTLSPGDLSVVCDYIPTYYDGSSTIKIISPPSPTIITQREYYRLNGLVNGSTYKFIFRTVDETGNKSYGVSLTASPEDATFNLDSPVPFVARVRDREINLSWAEVSIADGYKVYRAGPIDLYKYQAIFSEFSLLGAVEGYNNTSMYDIGLTNNQRYAYVVTSYAGSSESTFNVDDQVFGSPVSSSVPEPPENLSGTVISGRVDLSWDPPSDITGIEGWNIYRNTEKYGEFVLIDSVLFTSLSYSDTGLIDGTEYYYIVRSFSNTVDINSSISSTQPSSSIKLGTVVTKSGAIDSITPARTIISDLKNIVSSLTSNFIKNHTHSVSVDDEFSETRNQALKINLSKQEDVTVFSTNDYQNYVSERDLVNYGSYIVYINDQIPNLLYEVDFDENKIVFETALYSAGGTSLYSEAPVVRLQFINLKEISGQLESIFLSDLNASKIVSGVLAKAVLPAISHRGRIKELAGVRTYTIFSDDNIYYDLNNMTYVVNDANVNIEIGDSTVFYDFFEYNSVLYGASSKGVLKSSDHGITWESHAVFNDLIRGFKKSESGLDILYFAIGRRAVYFTRDGENWFSMNGLDSSNIIHGLSEDSTGNVYVATDTGVFVYDLQFASAYKFNAASVIKFESTTSEILSVINIGGLNTLVSTSDGVFATSNLGVTWNKSASLNSFYSMRRWSSTEIICVDENGDVYKTIDNGVNWVKNSYLSGIDNNSIFNVIDGRLFFSTSSGVFFTDDLETIIEINGGFKNRLSKSYPRSIYGTLKDNVLISFDNKLYRWKGGKTTLWSEFVGTIPSLFSNDILINSGYYYDVNNNDLYFEWKKSYDDINSIAVDYLEYHLTSGGWQDIDEDDVEVSAYVNGEYLGSIVSADLDDAFIDVDSITEKTTNKRYEFSYADDRKITVYSSNGKVYITGITLSKYDIIHISVENVTFSNEGVNSHDEIDNALSRRDSGLPFGLGNTFLDNLLQMGLFAEHNFIESIQTDTEYPYASTRTIRSFNSELINSDHFIFSKKFYDVFNSTIDYVSVSENKEIDISPFIINGFFETNGETWVATDRNIFVLSADRNSIDREIVLDSSLDLDVTSVKEIESTIYVVASNDLYLSSDSGLTWTKNEGYGLPPGAYEINNVFNLLVIGCSDGVYYSQFGSDTWTKVQFYDSDANSVVISDKVSSLISNGSAYCLIDNSVYKTLNGVTWRESYSFDSLNIDDMVADRLFQYNNIVFAVTNKGLYSDVGSLNNSVSSASFSIRSIDATNSAVSIKSFSDAGNRIVILSGKNTIYRSDDYGTTWSKQTISTVDFADLCHVWERVKIVDASISQMNAVGIESSITDKLVPIKDITYDSEEALKSSLISLLTTVEYNNYSDKIVLNSKTVESDTEIISSLSDLYVRKIDLSFDFATTTSRADRIYSDMLKQPITGGSSFDKVSIYLIPGYSVSSDYSISLSVYGADSSNNIVTGILSSDIKSSSDLYGPGWYNFRLYYSGGYDRLVLVLTQNYGDNDNTSKWSYIEDSSSYGAINNDGAHDYSYNFIIWDFEDSSDFENLRLVSATANQSLVTPEITGGQFYQTEYADDKVKLSLEPRVLSFLVDQSGSLTWNDYNGSRFDLIREFSNDLNNVYPGDLYYSLCTYGSKIIDTLEIERVADSDDSIYGGTYRIVRRSDTYPSTPIDGSIIANTGLSVASDDTVVNGSTYYYSIFNMRDDSVYSLASTDKITVHNRSIPLPVNGLSLEEVVVKETIGVPSAEVDTGKRKIIIKFRTIQNYSSYYNEVRIIRKYGNISNASDGTLVYEGVVTSGENIIIDDFSGTYGFINGVEYFYSVYTKNATGNYCLPQNSLQESITVSSVWRSWMYDSSYIASQIPAEFLVSPSDVENFSIEAGNTQNKISWTLPTADTAIGVMIYMSKEETPDIDPLNVAQNYAIGSTGNVSSEYNFPSSGDLIYQGDDEYFVHRELENNRRYYYRVYTFNRVMTLSAGNTIGEAIPLDDIVDTFEPPSAEDFCAEIFSDEKIILRWNKNSFSQDQFTYFANTVTIRSYAYDESGVPIPEIENFDFDTAEYSLSSKEALEYDGESSGSDISTSDYVALIDKKSYSGEIRAIFNLLDLYNKRVLSNYSSANFTVKSNYKIYNDSLVSKNEEVTAAEAGVDDSLYADGLVDLLTDDALEFALESGSIEFSFRNPLTVYVRNKYPETQKIAKKETISDGFGGSSEQIIYYDGIYAKSGMSYYGDIEISFENSYLDTGDSVSVRAEVYELSHRETQADGSSVRVWKQTPSEIFELEDGEITISNEDRNANVKDDGGNTTSDRTITASVGTFRLVPADQAVELNVLVTTVVNGYKDRQEHFITAKTMLNVDISGSAPSADGREVAEQFVNVYVGPPSYDSKSKLSRTNVPDGTLVKWELENGRFGQSRPFYSSESVSLQDGVYSVVRDGVARNVFFGPASDVKKHYVTNSDGEIELIGEEYTVKASVVYDGMFGNSEEDISIDPLEVTGTSYRFYMTNGYEMTGHVIYADGSNTTNFEIHADPLVTDGDGGQTFYDCLDVSDMPYIALLDGQKISLQSPGFGTINESESDIVYTYDGETYTDPELIPIEIESGLAEFSLKVNAFVGPPPEISSESSEDVPKFSKCYFYGAVPQEKDYPPIVSFSGQSQMIFGGKSITMVGGGSRTDGMPPVVIILKEPLDVGFQKMVSKGSTVLSPPNDGINTTDIYFEISFSEQTVPNGTKVAFEFVFSNGTDEFSVESIELMSENARKTLFAGFSSYEEFISEINLKSYEGITSTVGGRSVVYCTLNATKIKQNANISIRATSTYDKLGTVERTMSDQVDIRFAGTEDEIGSSPAYLKKVERYNTVSDLWEEIDSMLVGRIGFSCEYDSVSEKTLAFSGLTADGVSSSCEVFEYDRADKSGVSGNYGTWSYISDITYSRAFSQSVVYNEKVYVLGGFGLDPFSGQSGLNSNGLCEVYDINLDSWSVINDMPHPVSHGCAELIGDNIYVFSGLSSLKKSSKGHEIDSFNNYLMKYNITSGVWTTIDELNEVSNVLMRVSPASYVKSGKIYVFGGILNEYDDANYTNANFASTLIEIDVSDENNITYSVVSYSNTPIKRFRTGAYAILNNEFYMAGGSGIKQYFDGTVTRTFHSNTLRALEGYDTTTDTWTTYRNLSKMTYERNSPGATDDGEYFYVLGGGGSGYETGKLLTKITLSPDRMKADSRTQVSAGIELFDTTGEPPTDGVKMLINGYVLISISDDSSESVSTSSSLESKSQTGTVNDMARRVSIYPVLFSALTLYSENGAAGTTLLERGEDVLVALSDLVQYINGDDSVIGIVYNEDDGTISVPSRQPINIELGVERKLYKIIVEVTIEDDFYFGRTDTEKTLASNMSGYLQYGQTGLLPGETRDTETGEIIEDPDYIAIDGSAGGSLTLPEAASQEASPTVQVYNDMVWIPYVNDNYDIMTFSEFSDELDLLSQATPFGGSPHWDGIIDMCQNVLKQDEIISIEKVVVDVSDNEENLSENSLDDAINQIHLVDGYQKVSVFTNLFVTSFPPSLSARKGQSDIVDLEKIAGETLGLSHTISDASYVTPIVKKIKAGSTGSMGRGTYTQIIDFGKSVHIVSLEGVFELYQNTSGWIETYGSLDGYNYESIGTAYDADVVSDVNFTTRYLRFVVNLSSEFADSTLLTAVPTPAFLNINFVYSEPKIQNIYTYSYDISSYIREIYLTMNGTIPSTSSVKLGYTSSNSTIWDDYAKDSQPSVYENGRIVTVNSTMSLLNLVDSSSVGGKTSKTYKTYEEITKEFVEEKESEYGKVIDSIVILENKTATSDGSSKITFADGNYIIIDEAPGYSDAIDFSVITGQDPTKYSTSGTILNYDFIYSSDGYLFKSRYGRWQPDAVVNIYKNGILIDQSGYVLIRHAGAVKFFSRQRLTNNYAIEVSLSPKYRIGFEVTNRGVVNSAILDEFAYIYNTNFIKSSDYNNSIPIVFNLYVTPISALTSSKFKANYTYSDGNNDVERNSEIQWYINGGIISELKDLVSWSASDLSKNILKDGDRIFFTVKPSDGKIFGSLTSSSTTYLGNTPPSISGLDFSYIQNGVASVTPNSNVDIYVKYTYYDTYGRAEYETSFEWFINGTSLIHNVEDQSFMANNTTDSDGNYVISRGNIIKVRVIPSNGIIKGIPYDTDEIVILNSAPYISGVSLSPDSPDSNSTLVVSYAFGDRDGDDDQTEIRWFNNGVAITTLNDSYQVNASNLVSGDSWYAELTPYDGQNRGITVRTSTTIIT